MEYNNNVNAGIATVTVTGAGNYTGTVTKTFTIVRETETTAAEGTTEATKEAETTKEAGTTEAQIVSMSSCSVTLSDSSYTYDGTAKSPGVTVTYGGKTLTNGTDYTVAYRDNTDAGTATVTVTGKGNYSGTVSKTFTIARAANTVTVKNKVTLTASASKKQTVTLKVSVNGSAKVTYSSFKSKGSVKATYKNGKITFPKKFVGKVTIKATAAATDNYKKATKTITITVNPTKTTLSSVKNTAGKKVTVKWKKNSLATGYQVQYSTSKSFASGKKTVTVKKAATTSTTIKSLKKGKTYYVRIRTYKTVSGKKYYSDWSKAKKVKVTK